MTPADRNTIAIAAYDTLRAHQLIGPGEWTVPDEIARRSMPALSAPASPIAALLASIREPSQPMIAAMAKRLGEGWPAIEAATHVWQIGIDELIASLR